MVAVLLPCYASEDDIKAVMDIKFTANMGARIRRQLDVQSRAIEGALLLNRRFYPVAATRYFDWPGDQYTRSWRLWLRQDELVSASSVTAGGTTIAASDYFLEPANSGPPYNRLEIDLSSSAALSAGDTSQRAVAITGVWHWPATEETAGTITANVSSDTATTIAVSDSSLLGAGDFIRLDSERLVVTGKAMVDTGQNCTTLAAELSAQSITSITAGTIAVGETLLVDSERMLVTDIAGTTLTVKRAYDGTTLAAHTAGADIYAPRTLTVIRGAGGTTAATHTSAAVVYKHIPPGPVHELCVALTVTELMQHQAGFARMAGQGENARETSGRGVKTILDSAMRYRRNRGPEAV